MKAGGRKPAPFQAMLDKKYLTAWILAAIAVGLFVWTIFRGLH